jgi:hypothetical protein
MVAFSLCASGCIGYTGSARSVTPEIWKQERGWVAVQGVRSYELKRQRPVIVGMAKPTATGAVSHYEVVVGIHPPTQRILTLVTGRLP